MEFLWEIKKILNCECCDCCCEPINQCFNCIDETIENDIDPVGEKYCPWCYSLLSNFCIFGICEPD